MEPVESRAFDTLYPNTTNPGQWYGGQPNNRPGDNSKGVPGERTVTSDRPAMPAVGQKVRHRLSGQEGTVTGVHAHAHTGERMPMVRWDGHPAAGFTVDQGYSLDNLTNP